MPICWTNFTPRGVRSPGCATCHSLRLGQGWLAYGELVEAASGERTPCRVSTITILSCGVWLSAGVISRKTARRTTIQKLRVARTFIGTPASRELGACIAYLPAPWGLGE